MTRSSEYRSDIEGLRGIAVLSVVIFHCGVAGVTGGFVGVDVFFVLSGYLITGLLVKEIQTAGKLHLLRFYARRVRRLLPAAALVSIVTLIVGAIILAPTELSNAARAARATSVYLSNLFFSVNAENYFARDVKLNPMLHTWSLAVEEQFYLFWPMLIMIALQHRRSPKLLVVLLSVVTVISLAASIRLTTTSPASAFYGLPTRAWEFGIGGLATLIPPKRTSASASAWIAFGWLGLAAVVASFHFISERDGFPGWIAVFPVLGTTAVLVAGAKLPHRGVDRVLDSKPLQFLGTMSYSWYLWHWPFLVFAAELYPGITASGRILAAIAALGVATIAHNIFENPLRYQPRLIRNPLLSLGFGGVLMAVSLSAAIVTMRFANRLAVRPEMRAITAAIEDVSGIRREECVSLAQDSGVKVCSFGDSSSATTVVLFGDSHAIQWFNPLQRIAELHRWRLETMLKSGCPATDIPAGRGCAPWRAEAFRRIRSLHPAIVVVGNASVYLGSELRPGVKIPVSVTDWGSATRRTLTTLSESAAHIVAIRDNPIPPFDVPTCLERAVRHSWFPPVSCQIDKNVGLVPAVFKAEEAAMQGLRGVEFLDLTDHYCEGSVCPSVKNGMIVYRDDNHLTAAFAASLGPVLEARLVSTLGSRE
jgi:peptidoglycan/LPS O-acetylase OafA/YrhL